MSEMKRYQRKLIPLNIVVMIISLIAAVSIMFLPLVTIDFSKGAEALIDIINPDKAEDGQGGNSEMPDMDGFLAEGLGSLKLSVTTMNFAKMAFADDPVKAIAEAAAKAMRTAADKLLNSFLTPMLPTDGVEIDRENIDRDALCEKIKSLETADDPDAVIRSIAEQIVTDGNVAEADRDAVAGRIEESIGKLYAQTVEYTGSFSVEGLICTFMSQGNGDEGGLKGKTFDEMLYNMMTGKKEISQMLTTYRIVGFFLFITMAFPAAMWAILFLFALFHTLAKNKKFTMWYVKLFGFSPCLIFTVMPLAGKSVLAQTAGAEYATLLGCISSTTWISGVCYILLWLVSICWAFPIKKRIRRLHDEGVSYKD